MRTIIKPDAPSVEVQSLTKIYGRGNTEVVAMREVSFQVRRGEVVALLGPSGAGKSTLLTAIGLINPPTSGKIAIGGCPVMNGPRPLVDIRAFRRKYLGFVFQKANLIPFLNALENVQVAMEINDVPSRKARDAPWNFWITWASPTALATCPPCSPAASSSAWPWPAPWRTIPA